MPNLTVFIPPQLYRKMKLHPEVKWSEIVRKAISNYLEEFAEIVEASELIKIANEAGVNLDEIPLDRAIDYTKKVRSLGWKRLSTIPAP
jgi:predicted DsbA family dithiol-disulfide isomerase